MAKARPAGIAADIIALTGLTQQEAADYLAARGVKCTFSGVRAWCRGLYAPPAEALDALWALYLAVSEDEPMPPEAPDSVRDRMKAIDLMRDWYRARHPDPSDPPGQEEAD